MTTSIASPVTLSDTSHTWNDLTNRVDAFIAAWEKGGESPLLAPFVPDAPQALRHLVLVELIKVDLDYRWSKARGPRQVEEYVRDFPELAIPTIPADLLYEEFHIRKRAGDAVSPQEFQARFPAQAHELARLFHLEAPEKSLGLCGRGKDLDTFEPGQQLDDFDLLTVLGQGSFARVFLARQRSMQRLVALKISTDRGTEPQTLAQLDHPQIVRVFDQRLLPEQGLRLLYMQYLPGGDLQQVIHWLRQVPVPQRTGKAWLQMLDQQLQSRGEEPPAGSAFRTRLATLNWPEVVCWLGARLASALDYAHRQGVLHRDVKPANVLLTAEGLPKLADFNVSCSKLEGVNPAAFFGGSLAYMSPEQLEACNPSHPSTADSLDGRCDLYSLGITLWELLTGQRPFPEEYLAASWSITLDELTNRRRAGIDPAMIAQLPPSSPPGLAPTLCACLAPNREQRISSGQVLAWRLELCLQPAAQRLLHPPALGWQDAVARHPLPATMLAALLPNLLGAWFNFSYNRQEIVAKVPEALPAFWNVQLGINSTAFPLGLTVLIVLMLPLARAMRLVQTDNPPTADQLFSARRRSLKLGHIAAGFSLLTWSLAGVIYPVSLGVACPTMPASAYGHFMASLVLCGLIAAAYPFFFVTFLSVRVFYPRLIQPGSILAKDAASLLELQRLLGFYLLLAALVPMLAVLALVLRGSENRWALVALSAGGVGGVSLAFLLFRTIGANLGTLARILDPTSE